MSPILEPVGFVLRAQDVIVEVEGESDLFAYLPGEDEKVPTFKWVRISATSFSHWLHQPDVQGTFVRLPPAPPP